jgi:predicted metal-dependent hydrolase
MSEAMTEGASEATEATPSEQTPAAATPAPAEAPVHADWVTGIEDEKVRNLAGRYTTPEKAAEALYEANRELSQRVKMPGEDASDEDRAKFAKAMGVPEKAEDYKIIAPEHVSEEVFESDQYQAPIRGILDEMHRAGANQSQIDALLGKYWQMEAMASEEQARIDAEHITEAESDLRREWGSGYEENLAHANQYMEKAAPGLAQLELKNGMALGSYPPFIRMMAESGRISSEGRLQLGLVGTAAGQDLQSQYDDLSDQFYTAYHSGNTDQAKRLDAQRREVGEKLFGSAGI